MVLNFGGKFRVSFIVPQRQDADNSDLDIAAVQIRCINSGVRSKQKQLSKLWSLIIRG